MQSKRTTTIFTRMFLPLFFVMLLQSAILYGVTLHGRVVNALNSNATDILIERVDNRSNELESQFTSRWTNMKFYSDMLDRQYQSYSDKFDKPLYADKEQQKAFIKDASGTLFAMLRNNSVSGVFLILNSAENAEALNDKSQLLYGFCVRDYDINSGYTDKEDLMLLRCPSAIIPSVKCSLDTYWEAGFDFRNPEVNSDYYYKPVRAAYENPDVSSDNLAYFCGPHTYSEGDRPVVSYSIPLIGEDGRVYGVLGIEMTTAYLSTLLPSGELYGQGNGAYMLVQYEEGSNEYRVSAVNGTLYQRCFGNASEFTNIAKDEADDKLFRHTGRQDLSVWGSISPLKIYNRNTPFENEIFALVGIVQKEELFSVSTEVRNSLFFVTGLTLLIGCFGILIVSHLLANPIKSLAKKVQSMDSQKDTELQHINITEIDQLIDAIENQSRKISQSKVRTEFFSRMSHDMRTPMNAIIGFSSPEIVEQSSPSQMEDYLKKINNSGKYLLGLINEVLSMTKIDSGRLELENNDFSLTELWKEILPMIDELTLQKNINFMKEYSNNGDYLVRGDSQRLSQIVMNLLSNAVKFTQPNGSVRMSVQEEIEDKLLYCRISVKDTGIGMSKEFMSKKLYQPFTQEHTNLEGTGLGLSITYQLVSLMGGTIQCVSQQGKGTEFIVTLKFPLAETTESGTKENKEYTEKEIGTLLKEKRILLCEDHPLNQQIAQRLLAKRQILVDVAGDGAIGLDMFRTSSPGYYDAILMDIRMPVMNGLEATREIRKLEREDAGTIPVIAMTANAFKEDIEECAEAGMNSHLSKPVEPQKLYQELARCLDRFSN